MQANLYGCILRIELSSGAIDATILFTNAPQSVAIYLFHTRFEHLENTYF